MQRRGDQVVSGLNRYKVQLAARVDSGVVLATPVDTGQARGGWRVSVNAPDLSERQFIEGEHGSTGAANAQAAIAQGVQAIAAVNPGDSIYITNTVEHIVYLNDLGNSAQAPKNFVQREIRRAIDAMQGTKILPDNNRGGKKSGNKPVVISNDKGESFTLGKVE